MVRKEKKKPITPSSIVSKIKQSIIHEKQKNMEWYETHPTECIFLYKNNTKPLIDGWYEIDERYEHGFCWTKKEFSFFFNPGNSPALSFHIIKFPPGHHKKSLAIKLYMDDVFICEKIIQSPGLVTFDLPPSIENKLYTVTGKLSYTGRPVELRIGDDIRHLGIGIRAITNAPISEGVLHHYDERYEDWVILKKEIQKRKEHMKAHIDPRLFIYKKTPFKSIKILVYRILRLYTSVQSQYNRMSIEQMDTLCRAIELQMNLTYEMQMHTPRY